MRAFLIACLLLLVPGLGSAQKAPAANDVVIETTLGKFTIRLFADKAPVTVKNFLEYVDAGFYDGTVFYEYDDQSAAQIAARYRRAYDEFYTPARKLRMLGGVRSWSELSWLVRAWLQVRRSPGGSGRT